MLAADGTEFRVFRETVRLTGWKTEDDSDIHVAVQALAGPQTMVIEFPLAGCIAKSASNVKKHPHLEPRLLGHARGELLEDLAAAMHGKTGDQDRVLGGLEQLAWERAEKITLQIDRIRQAKARMKEPDPDKRSSQTELRIET